MLGEDSNQSSSGNSRGSAGASGSAGAGGESSTSRSNSGGSAGGSATGGNGNTNTNARYYNNQASTVVVNLLRQNHIYARPLGNVIYMMPSLITPPVDRERLIRVIKRCITKAFYLRQPVGKLSTREAGFVPHRGEVIIIVLLEHTY